MKKFLLSFVLLAALASPAFTQEQPVRKWTARASAAYLPTVPAVASFFGALVGGIAISLNKDSNESLEIFMPPFFSIEALYSFNDMWSLGVDTGYCGSVFKIADKDTGDVSSTSFLTLIPLLVEGRCNYLNRPVVKLYGSLEAGAMFSVGDSFDVIPSFQLNPIGIELGRRFFALAELGIGFNYIGGRAGVGFRF